MSKLFKSSDYVEDMIRTEFSNCGLEAYGIVLNVISTIKAKEVIKVSKASPETEFLTNKESMITITVYEQAFEKIDEDGQKKVVEGAISCISYDSEKDKINIDKSEGNMFHRMRHKYNNDVLNIFEQASLAIQQIEDEEKEAKEAAKEAKAAERESKKNK